MVKLGIKNFYDGIFMDLDFPIPWGVKACKALRAHETKDALEPVPIIAVIAHRIDTETIKECKEAGMQGVIETGFPKEKFMNFLSLCEKYKRNATSLPNKYSTNKHIN